MISLPEFADQLACSDIAAPTQLLFGAVLAPDSAGPAHSAVQRGLPRQPLWVPGQGAAFAVQDVRNERFRRSREAAKLLTQKLVPPKELKAMQGEARRAAKEGKEGPAPLQQMDLGDSSRKVSLRPNSRHATGFLAL